jgi:hypothetical protein
MAAFTIGDQRYMAIEGVRSNRSTLEPFNHSFSIMSNAITRPRLIALGRAERRRLGR